MTDKELVKALKHLAVQTGSLACLGCGHEHSCSIHGCAVIRAAIEALEEKKSADQMFKELGYERCDVTENPISGVAAYQNFNKYGRDYRIEITSGHSVFAYIDGELCGISEDEVPAIAQALKEMEERK